MEKTTRESLSQILELEDRKLDNLKKEHLQKLTQKVDQSYLLKRDDVLSKLLKEALKRPITYEEVGVSTIFESIGITGLETNYDRALFFERRGEYEPAFRYLAASLLTTRLCHSQDYNKRDHEYGKFTTIMITEPKSMLYSLDTRDSSKYRSNFKYGFMIIGANLRDEGVYCRTRYSYEYISLDKVLNIRLLSYNGSTHDQYFDNYGCIGPNRIFENSSIAFEVNPSKVWEKYELISNTLFHRLVDKREYSKLTKYTLLDKQIRKIIPAYYKQLNR
jgi:hypothetical protein